MENVYSNEVWRPVKGYEGLYEVSNYGRVRSVERIISRNNKGSFLLKSRILKPTLRFGYLRISLKKDKSKWFFIHYLVTKTFLPNPNNLPQINHKDENKLNNFVWINDDGSVDPEKSNLEWCTAEYNINYGNRNKIAGEHIKKPIVQFSSDGKRLKEWPSATDVQKATGINQANISACLNGKRKTTGGFIWRYL